MRGPRPGLSYLALELLPRRQAGGVHARTEAGSRRANAVHRADGQSPLRARLHRVISALAPEARARRLGLGPRRQAGRGGHVTGGRRPSVVVQTRLEVGVRL